MGRGRKGMGGEKKGRSGKEGVGRGKGNMRHPPLALGGGRPCAETQINHQEDHFHCTPCTLRVPKVGGQCPPTPHGCAAHDHERRKGSVVGGTMASVEHEPITGVWGHSPQRDTGAEPPAESRGRAPGQGAKTP